MSDSTPFPLEGLRVIELSHEISGPYAGKLLADAGAFVIKVEPPSGDPLRAWAASGHEIAPGEDWAIGAEVYVGELEQVHEESIEMLVADDCLYAGAARAVTRDPAAFGVESPTG